MISKLYSNDNLKQLSAGNTPRTIISNDIENNTPCTNKKLNNNIYCADSKPINNLIKPSTNTDG